MGTAPVPAGPYEIFELGLNQEAGRDLDAVIELENLGMGLHAMRAAGERHIQGGLQALGAGQFLADIVVGRAKADLIMRTQRPETAIDEAGPDEVVEHPSLPSRRAHKSRGE